MVAHIAGLGDATVGVLQVADELCGDPSLFLVVDSVMGDLLHCLCENSRPREVIELDRADAQGIRPWRRMRSVEGGDLAGDRDQAVVAFGPGKFQILLDLVELLRAVAGLHLDQRRERVLARTDDVDHERGRSTAMSHSPIPIRWCRGVWR